MDLSVFQRTIVNEEGATLPAAQIDVFLAGTATRPDLFSDAAGTTPITNPFNADVNGFAQFYVEFGNYDVTANLGGSTATWDDVLIGRTPLAYNDDTASYIDNTLVSGAIIEKGSNANGRYLKYAIDKLKVSFVKLLVNDGANVNEIVKSDPLKYETIYSRRKYR